MRFNPTILFVLKVSLIASTLVQVLGQVAVAGQQFDVANQESVVGPDLMVVSVPVAEESAYDLPGFPVMEVYLQPEVVAQCAEAISSPAIKLLRNRAQTLLKKKQVADAEEWTLSVLMALCANDMPLAPEYVSLVFAIIEKESSFVAHGLLPNQPEGFHKLAHRLIDDIFSGDSTALDRVFGQQLGAKLARAVITLAKKLGILSGERAKQKFDKLYARFDWHRITTEWDIENVLSEDILTLSEGITPLSLSIKAFLAYFPDVEQRLRSHSLLRSVGPMQVSTKRERPFIQDDLQELTEDKIRRLLYTIEGGVYFGTKKLQRLVDIYAGEGLLSAEAVEFIAADYTAGFYISRNAAFIQQIGLLADARFPADTTLRSPQVKDALKKILKGLNGSEDGAAKESGINSWAYLEQIQRIGSLARKKGLEQSILYQMVKRQYGYYTGRKPVYAVISRKHLYSPKNGAYAIAAVAKQTRETFRDNCLLLGCKDLKRHLEYIS
jgi:hypothetical protein